MPNDTKKRPEFDPALWASYAPEALRVPLGTALGALKEFWPSQAVDLPGYERMNVGMPGIGGMGMTTRFITKGVPNKALREMHTEKFLEAADEIYPSIKDKAAALESALFHPRTTAHTELTKSPPVQYKPGLPTELGLTILGPEGNVPIAGVDPGRAGKISVRVTPEIPKSPTAYNSQTPREVLKHELRHVGQGLGNKDFGQLYNLANEAVGYGRNPGEIAADFGARRDVGLMPNEGIPYSALRGLKSLGTGAWDQLEMGKIREALARQQITEILKDRAAGVPRDYDAIRNRALDALGATIIK